MNFESLKAYLNSLPGPGVPGCDLTVWRNHREVFRRTGYGYGLGVRTPVDNRYSESPIGEFGWNGAAGAHVLIDPQSGLSAFFAAHTPNFTRGSAI